MTTSLRLFVACVVLAGCTSLAGCGAADLAGPDASRDTAHVTGQLVMVGGGAKPKAAMRRFVDLSGGERARIVVLPLASGDSRETGAYYVDLFADLGVGDIEIVHVDDRRDAMREAYVRAIDRATGLWLSGGDQRRIAARLVDTPVHRALRRLHERGGAIGGTSAGTACQSEIMLTGDGHPSRPRPGAVGTTRGLGTIVGAVVDQHFTERKRQARLQSVLLDYPGHLGIGIDEDTALWIKPDGVAEVIGAGSVTFYRPAGKTFDSFSLPAGRRFDLRARAPETTP